MGRALTRMAHPICSQTCHIGSHRKPGGPENKKKPQGAPTVASTKGLDSKGQQGSDGLGEITSRLPGMGLSLTDSLPTDDYRKEITKPGPDKGGDCGWCGFLQAGTF